MGTPQHPTYLPNQFDLFSKLVHVQYATTSIDGKARLSYKDRAVDKHFSGEQIQTEDTALGKLVSVTLATVPDLQTVTFSFLLPTLNVDREAHVVTQGIYTTTRTSIGGPRLVTGQVESWRAVTLSGIARAVQL